MKVNPPPPSYTVAMEQQRQQTQPPDENIEPPSYQESARPEEIEPSDAANATARVQPQPAPSQLAS